MKIMIWGAGKNGNAYRKYIEQFTEDEFVGFVDNDRNRSGARPPSELVDCEYDLLVVSNQCLSDRKAIKEQLQNLSITNNKIAFLVEDEDLMTKVFSAINRYDEENDMRVVWLRAFANYAYLKGLAGNVAECGVNRGEFSYFINKFFPDRELYLFDTFDGFAEKDLNTETDIVGNDQIEGKISSGEGFKLSNLEMVKNRMTHLQQCKFYVGHFPDTAQGIDDEFCFVNLDMDLYKPTLDGLEFFFPKMADGEVILIHDYFSTKWSGVAKAIEDFEKNTTEKLHKFPIGDLLSIAIVK